MKITSIELHPDKTSIAPVVLSFRDPRTLNPYNAMNVTGLDADEIIPKFYGTDGADNFYSLAQKKRDISILAGLNPNFASGQSYSDLRDALYRIIASSRTGRVTLQLKDALGVVCEVAGFISKMETGHFEKHQEVQLTISCSEPLFKAPSPTVVTVGGLVPSNTVIQDNLSTAPHGMKFVLDFASNLDFFTIIDTTDLTWSFTVTPVGGFLAGDSLHFSSELNGKYLYIQRGSTIIHLADVIEQGSIWPIMFPGANQYNFIHATGMTWNAITYYPSYWGV